MREGCIAVQSAPSKFHHQKQYRTTDINLGLGWAWGRGGSRVGAEEEMKDCTLSGLTLLLIS